VCLPWGVQYPKCLSTRAAAAEYLPQMPPGEEWPIHVLFTRATAVTLARLAAILQCDERRVARYCGAMSGE
jgi:hypothetical protein